MKEGFAIVLALAVILSSAELRAFQQFPPSSGHALGGITGGDFKMANLVIQKKCTACHSARVIRQAIAAGKDMQKIQQRMEQKGVKLSADDRTVLGVFWRQTPLRQRK